MITDKVYVPPLKIQGIKTKLVPAIRACIPADREAVWVEPFMGSGVVGFNLAPPKAFFSDINPHIIAFYNQIKNGQITSKIVQEYLEQEGALLRERDEAHFYLVRERFNNTHDPLDFLFLNRSCFNGMIRFNRNYAFNVPYGHKPQRFAKAYITKIVNQVRFLETRFSENDWVFLCRPFEEAVASCGETALIYCDPPYIGRHVDYFDSWNEDLERALCQTLRQTSARFMLSTWDHNDCRTNEYIEEMWGFCQKVTHTHF